MFLVANDTPVRCTPAHSPQTKPACPSSSTAQLGEGAPQSAQALPLPGRATSACRVAFPGGICGTESATSSSATASALVRRARARRTQANRGVAPRHCRIDALTSRLDSRGVHLGDKGSTDVARAGWDGAHPIAAFRARAPWPTLAQTRARLQCRLLPALRRVRARCGALPLRSAGAAVYIFAIRGTFDGWQGEQRWSAAALAAVRAKSWGREAVCSLRRAGGCAGHSEGQIRVVVTGHPASGGILPAGLLGALDALGARRLVHGGQGGCD